MIILEIVFYNLFPFFSELLSIMTNQFQFYSQKISRVFGNFTVTFVTGPLFRAKKHPKTKSAPDFFLILELCRRTFFS
jgi:hypothetical protein